MGSAMMVDTCAAAKSDMGKISQEVSNNVEASSTCWSLRCIENDSCISFLHQRERTIFTEPNIASKDAGGERRWGCLLPLAGRCVYFTHGDARFQSLVQGTCSWKVPLLFSSPGIASKSKCTHSPVTPATGYANRRHAKVGRVPAQGLTAHLL